MRLTRRALLGTVAGTAALAGCAGDGGGDAATTTTGTATTTETQETTATTTTTTETTEASAATVQVREHPDLGDILVDSEGMTLYMFDSDTRGEGASTCTGGCAEAWPPLTGEDDPTAGDGVAADLTTFERESGDRQVAAGGWPLYYFASDESPGDANGQGAGDVWWVLAPDGTPVKPETTTAGDSGY